MDGATAPVGGSVDSAMLGFRRSLDLAGIYVDGKRAQVDALNRAGVSLEEYRWTRSRVYAALDVPFMELDIPSIIAEVKEGRQAATPAYPMAEGPPGSPACGGSSSRTGRCSRKTWDWRSSGSSPSPT